MKKRTILCLLVILGAAALASAQDRKEVSLTLEESIVKALKNNLNLAVEVYSPRIAEASLSRAREMFFPQFNVTYGRNRTEQPSTWWLQGAETLTSTLNDYNVSVNEQIPLGGNLSLSLAGYKSTNNQRFQLINPIYSTTLRFNFSQPLLRGFGYDISRQQIIVARNNLSVSESQLQSALVDTVYLVEDAYWNYVYAIENLKVKQQSLSLGRDLLAKTRKEVEVGAQAPIEVLNAEATVAQREADILVAEALVKKSEETLRSVINLGAEAEMAGALVVPSDKPVFTPTAVTLEEALNAARARRPDLQIAQTTIETRRLSLRVARNGLLPQVDLNLSYWSPGISGDRLIVSGDDFLNPIILGMVKGSASDSLKNAMKFSYSNWDVGLTLTVPLGDVLSRANYAQARLELDQSLASLKTQEQQVFLDVSDAVRSVETDAKKVNAFRLARELAAKRLEAEMKKLGVGLTTNYFVLQYQEQLATARSNEIRALVDYNLSLARLNKATGKTLESRHIAVAEGGR